MTIIHTKLAEDDFHEIYLELTTIKANYFQLGIVLGLPPGELQAIQQTCSQNVAQALTQALLTWLRQLYNVEKHGAPTWQRLVEAVGSPAGGNNHALAMDIASRHCTIGMLILCSRSMCILIMKMLLYRPWQLSSKYKNSF